MLLIFTSMTFLSRMVQVDRLGLFCAHTTPYIRDMSIQSLNAITQQVTQTTYATNSINRQAVPMGLAR